MNQYQAPAVDLAARILKLLTRYRMSEATLTMISTELQAPKASCLRVLRTLEGHGLLRYDADTRRYSLGPYAVVIGARAAENIDYLAGLRPLLREASERTGCTSVVVQQVDANRMMYLAKHEGTNRLRVGISIGNRFPVTEVSYGKWLLAYAPAEVRDALLADGLRKVTPHTVVDRETYLAQLEEIRQDGVLVSREEYVLGVTAVSCPVFDVHEKFLGVLAVLGLIPASDEETMAAVVATMRDIAKKCYLSGTYTSG
jgi:IclR family transcriptional regulator, KDG regulon repressor